MTDPEAAAELDAYLAALQAGQRPDRDGLLALHPTLSEALLAIDALQGLGPAPAATCDDARTMPQSDPSTSGSGVLNGSDEFGPYRLLGELGRGGMGVVYKAVQVELDRPVALKMILGNHLATEQQVRRFHAEAKAAARLHHPNVVQVYESGTCAGQHYFAMEYVEGPSLSERLRAAPLPLREGVRLLAEVARAVAHLHAHGLIHRDLKPGNVLLAADGRTVLTDFGLAKALDGHSRITASGAVVGTPSYMAPEQAAGEKGVGPHSDIYSLGAILYELLTGRPPFQADSFLDVIVQVIEKDPLPPRQLRPNLPQPLEAVCLKCLEKDPGRRYASSNELADDLERWLAGEPVAAQPQGLWRRLRGWARRQPALAARCTWLAAVAVVVEAHYDVHYLLRGTHHISFGLHLTVHALLAVWALLSWGCQRAMATPRWAAKVPAFWSAADVVLYTVLLYLTNNSDSPLLIGYPVLITASGLWSRERTVWLTSAMTVLGFSALVLFDPPRKLGEEPHHYVIFVFCLVALGFMVGYQVQRLRALSRTVEQRPAE